MALFHCLEDPQNGQVTTGVSSLLARNRNEEIIYFYYSGIGKKFSPLGFVTGIKHISFNENGFFVKFKFHQEDHQFIVQKSTMEIILFML